MAPHFQQCLVPQGENPPGHASPQGAPQLWGSEGYSLDCVGQERRCRWSRRGLLYRLPSHCFVSSLPCALDLRGTWCLQLLNLQGTGARTSLPFGAPTSGFGFHLLWSTKSVSLAHLLPPLLIYCRPCQHYWIVLLSTRGSRNMMILIGKVVNVLQRL